jgi:hypothetical protein
MSYGHYTKKSVFTVFGPLKSFNSFSSSLAVISWEPMALTYWHWCRPYSRPDNASFDGNGNVYRHPPLFYRE